MRNRLSYLRSALSAAPDPETVAPVATQKTNLGNNCQQFSEFPSYFLLSFVFFCFWYFTCRKVSVGSRGELCSSGRVTCDKSKIPLQSQISAFTYCHKCIPNQPVADLFETSQCYKEWLECTPAILPACYELSILRSNHYTSDWALLVIACHCALVHCV